MKNTEIAQIFRQIAQILEIQGENVFRIRAYDRAAQNIEGIARDIAELAKKEELHLIPGIGKDLAEKINEYLATGRIALLDELRKKVPEGVLTLLDIPSIGPKTAKLLYDKLHVESVDDLLDAIQKNKLAGLAGIKEKTIENILKGIEIFKKKHARMTLAQATLLADECINALKKSQHATNVIAAGSLRRRKDTVRDIDILVTSRHPQEVMDAFISLPAAKTVQARGETKSSIRTPNGVQIDCRVVDDKSLGAALLYFTGSKNFNIKMRQIAIKRGLKINEYGVFNGAKPVAAKTEKDIFNVFGMSYIEPELREDTGEIEAAIKNTLPKLITRADIRGDLHAHSSWSDGDNTIDEMARAARKLGYEYLAMTDHSQSLKVAEGLSIDDVKKKKAEIDSLNKKTKGFRILFGTEVDILSDGSIDYPDAILKDFDIVVAAIHGGFKQSKEQLTKRIIAACKNKYVNIIAHPTGRLWGAREAYDIDFEDILKAACDTNTHLEINSFPDRLDLNDAHARRAKEMGVKLSINTDSHKTPHLEAIRYGIAVARRAWLEPKDVINTRPLAELMKLLKK